MAPRNELNAGGPCFCHLAVPICLDLENKTSLRTFLGSTTPSPSQLRGGKAASPEEDWGGAEGFRGKRTLPRQPKYVPDTACSSELWSSSAPRPCMGHGPLQRKFGGVCSRGRPAALRGRCSACSPRKCPRMNPREKAISTQKGLLQQRSPRDSGWGAIAPFG